MTVAIPVLNGGALLGEVLAAVRAQRIDRPTSSCWSPTRGRPTARAELARGFGATVDRRRALLARRHAQPADGALARRARRVPHAGRGAGRRALARAAARGVRARRRRRARLRALPAAAGRAGRGRARAGRLVRVAGAGRRVRGSTAARTPRGPGAATFFTDANGAVARAAWERVPFRDVPYAEDQALALDMLRAGYAKAFMPDAAVVHSHEYGPLAQFRRSFDEWRGLREVHGWVEPAAPAARPR